jgi:Tol biopolymer transport system component
MRFLIFTFFVINAVIAFSQTDYLGFSKPGSTPEIFAPDIVSTAYAEFAGTFSPDMSEYYFTRRGPFPEGIAQIMVVKKEDKKWSSPTVADFSSNNYEYEPFITPDGKRLYFGSRRPINENSAPGKMLQWYLEKIEMHWSEPRLLEAPFMDMMVMYPSVSNNKTLYFTSIGGIFYSEIQDNKYQKPIKMNENINSLPLTAHPFIAPDESYIIYDCQPRGQGKSDIYVSFKRENGAWTKGISLGPTVNSGESQAIASVSPDGECLFFTRNGDIYWVDAYIIQEIKTFLGL